LWTCWDESLPLPNIIVQLGIGNFCTAYGLSDTLDIIAHGYILIKMDI